MHSYGPEEGSLGFEIHVSFDGPVFDELDRGGLIHKVRQPVSRATRFTSGELSARGRFAPRREAGG